ncbi:E3 ubiquitin-protein ligase MARCHF2 [Octopus vulgaris]|uniref:E3 ubiquitin-protein ligase MARCHF2 n=1 Tax=Octopus vulgaris TaxID=6645 RepID=A0AA36APQ7_OCTVU|nr:E3 ubiquitin-protein ligase MARCHF2 [Octopus vulgaris]
MNHQGNVTLQLQREYSRDESRSNITALNTVENFIDQDVGSEVRSFPTLPPEMIFSPHTSRRDTIQDVITTVNESPEVLSDGKEQLIINVEPTSPAMTDSQDVITASSLTKDTNTSEIDIKSNFVVKYHPHLEDVEKLSGTAPNIKDKSISVVQLGKGEELSENVHTDFQSVKTGHCDNISLSTSSDGDRSKDDTPCCRICHGSSSAGQLLSPCYCKGTQGQVHIKCLEHWLSCTGRTKCELCGYQFEFTEQSKSFSEFILCPGNRYVKNLLFCDILCFILVTPLTLASVSLVIATAALLDWKASMEVIGLILFAVFVIFLYMFWLITALRFQRNMWRHWKFRNRVVRIKFEKCKTSNSSRSSPWRNLRNLERHRNDAEDTVRSTFQSNQRPDSSNVQIWCSTNSQILVIPREPLES